MYVSAAEVEHVLADDSVPLKVSRIVGVAVFEASNSARRRFCVYAEGPDLKVVFDAVLLPCYPPIRRDSAYVDAKVLAVCGLARAEVRRAIDGPDHVQMLVPHGIAADSSDILPQALDEWRGRWTRRYVTGDEWEAPCRRIVPQIFDRGIVVQ